MYNFDNSRLTYNSISLNDDIEVSSDDDIYSRFEHSAEFIDDIEDHFMCDDDVLYVISDILDNNSKNKKKYKQDAMERLKEYIIKQGEQ